MCCLIVCCWGCSAMLSVVVCCCAMLSAVFCCCATLSTVVVCCCPHTVTIFLSPHHRPSSPSVPCDRTSNTATASNHHHCVLLSVVVCCCVMLQSVFCTTSDKVTVVNMLPIPAVASSPGRQRYVQLCCVSGRGRTMLLFPSSSPPQLLLWPVYSVSILVFLEQRWLN